MKNLLFLLTICSMGFIANSAMGQNKSKKLVSNPPALLENVEIGIAYDTFYQDRKANGGRHIQRGLNLSGGYEYRLNSQLSTTFKPNLTFYGEDMGDGDVDTFMMKYTQVVNYNYKFKDLTLRPFADASFGWGWESVENSQFDLSINGLVFELGAGVAFKMDNGLVPYFRMAYRYFDADRGDFDYKNGGDKKDEKTDLKNSSRTVQVGMAYAF